MQTKPYGIEDRKVKIEKIMTEKSLHTDGIDINLEKILISKTQIKQRIIDLGSEISKINFPLDIFSNSSSNS